MWQNKLKNANKWTKNVEILKELTLDETVGIEVEDSQIRKLIKNHPFLTKLNLGTHILTYKQIMMLYDGLENIKTLTCEIEGTMMKLNEEINYNIKENLNRFIFTFNK